MGLPDLKSSLWGGPRTGAEIIKAAGQNCSVKKNVKMNNFILYRQFMST